MSTLTYLQNAAIRDSVRTINGEVFSRPALFKTDGVNLTYAVNVRIASDDPGGEKLLVNVPIALGVRDVVYADPGAAVTLQRNGTTGRFEVTGFSKRKPGKHKRIAVDLVTGSAGPAVDVGFAARLLTLGELGDPAFGQGFGSIPLGAFGVFKGGTLVELKT